MSVDESSTMIEALRQEIIILHQQNEELRHLALFPQSNPNPVLEFDRTGQVVFINRAAQQTLSRVGVIDARSFLPDDFTELSKFASEITDTAFIRMVKLGTNIFEVTINFSPEYGTARIYALDVTQRYQMEELINKNKQKLKQTHELLEAVTKGTDVIIAAIDTNFCYTYFNEAYREEVKQLSGKDIHIGTNMLATFAHLPEQQKVVMEEWGQVLRGESTNKILEFGDSNIFRRVFNVLHTPIWDADGHLVGAGEVAYDITEQVHMQEALRESEARFRMVLKNAPITVAAQDKDLRFIWAYNQRTIDPSQVIGKTDMDLFPPDVADWLLRLKRQVLETGKDLREQGWVVSGGQHLFLELFLEPIRDKSGKIAGVGIATVDLTQMKLTEQALKESEERYRSLFEGMTEGFSIHEIIYDSTGKPCDYRFLDVNPAFELLTGLKRENVVGKTYREVLPGEGDSWVNLYGNVVLTGEPVQFENYSPTLKKHYEVYAYRCAPNQFAVIFLDITNRKKMEDDLRINLTKYTTLFETFPLGVTVSDQNGQILESNPEAIRLLGLSEAEQKQRQIDGVEWKIIRPDRTPMPTEEYASVQALKEKQRIENVEMGIVKAEDQINWISVTAAPLPLEGYGVVIAYNDITRRMQAEEALRQAHDKLEKTVQQRTQELLNTNRELTAEIEERKRIASQLAKQTQAVEAERKRFNDVLEILPAYLILLTTDYHVTFANRYFRERFGEDQGRRCYEYLFRRSDPCENCETYKVLKVKTPINWQWTGPDSHNYDVFDFPFTDVDGSNLILEMGIDVTARKQAEEKLRLSNAYNRSLLEANLDALVTITPDGKIGDVNTVTEAITGYTRQELIGTDFHNYFTDPEKARAGYRQVFEIGSVRDYELEIQHKDGHTTPVVYNASIYHDEDGNVTGVFAAARDITERKLAEKQLVLLTSALEAAANGIIVTDLHGRILWSNPAFSRMTGFAQEEIIGQNPRFLKSGKQDPIYYQDLRKTILAGKVWHGVLINKRKDGSLYYEEQTITPVFDLENNMTNFISIKQDITDHKRAEEALRKSEEKYRSLVIASTQIVWQTDVNGDVVGDIPMWRAYTGQSEREFQGRGWLNALHPADQERTAEIWAQAVKNNIPYDVEYRIRSHTGDYGYFIVRGVPIRDQDGIISGWIGTCTDITEKKRYENQLIQAEKHAVIGRMVGSVTHEINNPLQTITNCLYLIKQDMPPDSQMVEPLKMAFSETKRLSNLVSQLRPLYRPQVNLSLQQHDLLDIIDEVHNLITLHLVNSKVVWQSLAGLKRCKINCVKEQIIEVLLNICMNAIESMQPDGGSLSVDLIFPKGKDQVGILLQDTGLGIDAEVLPHIFEPFITNKQNGMGLGLSISYDIILKHEGQITVDSQPGRGTTFTVWMPLVVDNNEKGEQ
jgi:PAS domain S-box-containing protein